MQSLLFRQLDPEALDDLKAMGLVPYCPHTLTTMLKTSLVHITLPHARVASAALDFVKRWGTNGQLSKLHKLLLAAGVESPPLELTTKSRMSIKEQRDLRAAWRS